jgi:hypothetical protein
LKGDVKKKVSAMIRNASVINGYTIAASDGQLGFVSDFLFDDATWSIRWLVVDTGNWLFGRKVLLPPAVLGRLDPKEHVFSVRLTMLQVKDSPDIDTERPVSRQMETNIYDYYGWDPYWSVGAGMGGYGYMGGYGSLAGVGVLASPMGFRGREQQIAEIQRTHDDLHLRSIKAVTGYHVHGTDGEIGHVEDFLLEDADWSIHYLVIDTKNWWPGKKVLISPRSAREIDWRHKLVNLSVNRQRVKDSPQYDSTTIVDRGFEERFHQHYGD